MSGLQLLMSPFRLLPPGHLGVTGPHEVSPGGDHVLLALRPGEDQQMTRSATHVVNQLLKCLLGKRGETVTQGGGLWCPWAAHLATSASWAVGQEGVLVTNHTHRIQIGKAAI